MTSNRSLNLAAVAIVVTLVSSRDVSAQAPPRRVELGAFGVITRFADFDPYEELLRRGVFDGRPSSQPPWWEPGGGMHVTVHLTDRSAVEGELSLLARHAHYSGTQFRGGAKALWSAGMRYGRRLKHIGVFGKALIGAVEFTGSPAIFAISRTPANELIGIGEQDAVFPQLSFGAIVEMARTGRTVLRFDIEDQVVFYRPTPRELNPAFNRQNLRLTLGIGFGLGRSVTPH